MTLKRKQFNDAIISAKDLTQQKILYVYIWIQESREVILGEQNTLIKRQL